MGEFSARKLIRDRKKFRKRKAKIIAQMRRRMGIYDDPLEGAPMARGIVIKKVIREFKQPSSGKAKCVIVQLIKNGKQVTAFVPGDRAINYIDEHDEVTIVWIGGSQKGPVGDLWGAKFKVIKVNGVDLQQIRKGKKQKPRK